MSSRLRHGSVPVSRPRRRMWRWVLGSAVALALSVALVLGFVVGLTQHISSQASLDPAYAAGYQISDAALELAVAPAEKFTGSFTSDTGRQVGLDAQVSNEGSMLATLTLGGEEAQFLASGARRFVQASANFWSSLDAYAADAALYGGTWVQVDNDFLGVDLPTLLAPQRLAWLIADPVRLRETSAPGDVEDVNGVPARPIQAGTLTVWISEDEPQRIVRLRNEGAQQSGNLVDPPPAQAPGPDEDDEGGEGEGGETGEPDGGLAPELPEFALDLLEQTAEQAQQLLEQSISQRIRELITSVDSRVTFALNGQIVLAPCGPSGCTATVSLTNTVTSTSPYVMVNQPVNAEITTNMTLDGAPVGSCTATVVMPPNGSASTQCTAAYYVAPSPNPRVYTVRASAVAVARALIQTDIDAMLAEVTRERERSQTFLWPDSTPLVPGGGLTNHQRAGGHALRDHLGRTDNDLIARANQPNPPPDGVSGWTNREVAESTIAATLAANDTEIRRWLADPNIFKLELDYDSPFNAVTGRHVPSNSTTVSEVTGARVVLFRDVNSATGLGYYIRTSFPQPAPSQPPP